MKFSKTDPAGRALPQKWYVAAAKHWVENKEHVVNVYLVHDKNKNACDIIYALSEEWRRGLTLEVNQSDEAMKNELAEMEKVAVD